MFRGRKRSVRALLAAATGTAVVLAGSSGPALAAVTMVLSSATGPSGGGNTILGAASAPTFPAGTTPSVQFQYVGTGSTSCGSTARTVTQIAVSGTTTTAGVQTADPGTVRRISTTKIAFEVPSAAYPALDDDGNPSVINTTGLTLVGAQTSSRWNVCVYDSDSTISGTLLAATSYTLAVRPTITSIIPTSSPAGGGQAITVNGTGFTSVGAVITGAIGGVALTDVKVASDGNSFTATTGLRASGTGLPVTVTAPGGTVNSLDPDNDGGATGSPIPFAYTNGITISPNTAPTGSTVNLDVNGTGFAQLTFDDTGTPTSTLAHLFLVKDAYVAGSNRGVAECGDVVVVGDTELVCTLNLSADQLSPVDSSTLPGTPIADGAYILTVVANGDPGASDFANPTIVSSGATFTVAPY